MDIRMAAQGFAMTDAIEAAVKKRLETALGRLERGVMTIDVFMKDVNGPKGGRDKHVQLLIWLRGHESFAVESRKSDLYRAIADVTRKARRQVKRAIRKRARIERQQLRKLQQRPLEDAVAQSP